MKHLLSYLLLTFMISCDKKDPHCPPDDHNGLTLSNQSSKTVKFEFYWNYPDTAIGEYNPRYNGNDGLSTGEEFTRGMGRYTCAESVFRDGSKEWVYIFDNNALENIPWDTIRATQRGLLERRLIDLEYLKANDFRIIYK